MGFGLVPGPEFITECNEEKGLLFECSEGF